MSKKKSMSAALTYVNHVWGHVPTTSWEKFNGALYRSLKTAIESGMKFDEDDFGYMREHLRLGRWSGENLEWTYSLACGSERGTENASAIKAIEKHLGREPFIWAEQTKTPARLHVGSQFTWKGNRVTVTSFNDKTKSLVACAYKSPCEGREGFGPGVIGYVSHDQGYRKVEAVADLGNGSMVVRYGPKVEVDDSRDIARRFTVTLAELKAVRADYDKHRRALEKEISEAKTISELDSIRLKASNEGAAAYRHFDLDILRDAYGIAERRIYGSARAADLAADEARRNAAAKERLDRWTAGDDIRDYFGKDVRIRLKDGFVEASNGNKVTVKAAKKAIAFVRRHRSSGWQRNGQVFDIDAFPLEEISSRGVQVGCTLIPWAEVDRCDELLKGGSQGQGVGSRPRLNKFSRAAGKREIK